MLSCACCSTENVNDLDNTFNERGAQRDARRYLKRGLDGRGKKLIAYLLTHLDGQPATLLEIGGGAGGLQQELLRRGLVSEVVDVDASAAYIAAAQANAAKLGVGTAVTYHHADFAQNPEPYAPADVVILDRVICCYPYLEQLLGGAAVRANRFLALSFPIEPGWFRAIFWVTDRVINLFGSKYHPYIHPHADIEAISAKAGLRPVHKSRSGLWQIMVFARG